MKHNVLCLIILKAHRMIPDGKDINTSSNINWTIISILLFPIDNKTPISCMRSLSHRTNTKDKTTLVRMGYFNLVNGYKEPFICGKDNNGNHIYIANTSLKALYALKKFDDDLRMLLLKYITQ